MDKNAIKKYAVWARRELISRVAQRAALYDITEKNTGDPAADNVHGQLLTASEKKQRQALIAQIKQKGYQEVMEEVAYTWFNRFSALRFMEVNGYLPSHVRVFTDDDNTFKPQILTEAINLEMEYLDMSKVYELKNANENDLLFKYLIIVQCNALSNILPGMFQKIEDYTELLFPDNLLRKGSIIEQMIEMIPEIDWKDQVQIIGWLYQYYNSDLKDKAFDALKATGTIEKENIPAATQLFTPDWMVRYMVENSLGYLWLEGHENSELKSSWKYYQNEIIQSTNAQAKIDAIKSELSNIVPEELRVIDPCSGSGHILTYMFDALVQIYESQGYVTREAVHCIVENNLYGLDIDDRAAQLAYFSVMMKGRQYDSRFFKRAIQPHIYSIKESNYLEPALLDYFCNGESTIKCELKKLVEALKNAKEFGTLIDTSDINYTPLMKRLSEIRNSEISIFSSSVELNLAPMIEASRLLSYKYDVVCTNPPYMGNKGFSSELLQYIVKHFPEGKIDLYAAFILRCEQLTKTNRVFSMVTPESWMFLSRFEKLRRPLLASVSFQSMLHLGFNAFDSGFGTVAFSMIKTNIKDYKATCYRLVDYGTTEEKEQAIHRDSPFYSSKTAYEMVDGMPICYWVSDAMLANFEHPKVKDNGKTCVGLLTGNNDRFLRYWFEIEYPLLGIGYTHDMARSDNSKKWFPINQFGEYRKWYGNNMIVFDWWNDGHNIKKFKMDRYLAGEAEKKNSMCWNEDTYFMSGVTWNRISTNNFSARMSPEGNTAGSSSPIYFPTKRPYYLLALFNSCVFGSIVAFLNPTVSFQTADIEKVPVIYGESAIDEMAIENVKLAKDDWDSFETSYDFKRNPLI